MKKTIIARRDRWPVGLRFAALIACFYAAASPPPAASDVRPIRDVKSLGDAETRSHPRATIRGVVELSPFEFLDRLAELVPRPRKHRHRYHGVFAPNHKLRSAVTAHDKRECRQAA